MQVLACTAPEAEKRLRAALQEDELIMALTFDAAMHALATRRFDVVLVGMLFAESRALELVQCLREKADVFGRPALVGIRGAKIRRPLSPELFDVPMKALGARDVIDFGSLPDGSEGDAELRARIHAAAGAF